MAAVLLVCDTPDRTTVQQQGQPSTTLGAWMLDVADPTDVAGSMGTIAAWVDTQQFPPGTTAWVFLDLSGGLKYKLSAQWVPQ